MSCYYYFLTHVNFHRAPCVSTALLQATTSGKVKQNLEDISSFLVICVTYILFYALPGTGEGASKFIIHLEGGGWCYNEDDCVERSKTSLGSSKNWPKTKDFTAGLVGDDQTANPDFYNWNLAFVNYCDGASFAGNVYVGVIDCSGDITMFKARIPIAG